MLDGVNANLHLTRRILIVSNLMLTVLPFQSSRRFARNGSNVRRRKRMRGKLLRSESALLPGPTRLTEHLLILHKEVQHQTTLLVFVLSSLPSVISQQMVKSRPSTARPEEWCTNKATARWRIQLAIPTLHTDRATRSTNHVSSSQVDLETAADSHPRPRQPTQQLPIDHEYACFTFTTVK